MAIPEDAIDHSKLEVRIGHKENPTSAMGTVLNKKSITDEQRAANTSAMPPLVGSNETSTMASV